MVESAPAGPPSLPEPPLPGSPSRPSRPAGGVAAVVPVVALGGVIGALARYQVGRWWPTPVDGFPVATLCINLLGCLVLGGFLVLITERLTPHPLVRPFIGTGVLGGFTTFSTYALDLQQLLGDGRPGTALLYLTGTALGAVAAAALGVAGMRRLLPRRVA